VVSCCVPRNIHPLIWVVDITACLKVILGPRLNISKEIYGHHSPPLWSLFLVLRI
jgi:hypothetical protein